VPWPPRSLFRGLAERQADTCVQSANQASLAEKLGSQDCCRDCLVPRGRRGCAWWCSCGRRDV